MLAQTLKLGEIAVYVVRKDIRNVHLSVYPPTGSVRISAPSRMKLDTIRVFAISKLDWIKEQQRKLRNQQRESPREYLNRESHYVWGKRHLLTITRESGAASIELTHGRMLLRAGWGIDRTRIDAMVEKWYRTQIRDVVPALLAKWEPLVGVKVDRVFVQRMKTKWGSCSRNTRSIRLNTDLAKKPPQCLEYIVVHEMIHLLEPTHNARFVALMDRHMPQWRFHRQQLNRLPVRHEAWNY